MFQKASHISNFTNVLLAVQDIPGKPHFLSPVMGIFWWISRIWN